MADNKQFEPTPTWIARAKREGNIARSQELSAICGFLLGALALAALLPALGSIDAKWIAQAAAEHDVQADGPLLFGVLALLPLAAAAIGGTTASLVQERLVFVAPKFKLDRLNPKEGFKRMFSREAVIAAARAVLAFCLATWAIVPTANEVFARGVGVADLPFIASLVSSAALRIVLSVLVVGALFAIFDILIVRRRWRQKLRMNAYELKRDNKESEGDPLLRGRRRQMHRSLNLGPLVAVKDAAFVLTNPTHVAIALEYRPPEIPVPRVLVRALDESALRVREMAAEHGIPVVENVALARELYGLTQPGDEIPVETYVAVAEVVNALLQTGSLT
jgi:flagellar biosynthetic protein FlhB